jgi:mRNA-degrading endonuclease RelE of RelBE toxin-antitoxin system
MSAHRTELRFTSEFKRNLHILARKYRHIRSDIDPLILSLQNGERPGTQVQNVGYPVFKVRVRNSDTNKGKSGGYRLIYYVEMMNVVVLLTVYSKTQQSDIAANEIRRILNEPLE